MTAVRPAAAERFLAAPPAGVFLFLLHGENAGLVSLRAAELARRVVGARQGEAQVTRVDGDALAGSPGQLADEAYAISMFREKRALRVIAGHKALVPLFEPLLANPPQDFFVVVESGALKRDAALRKLAEQASGAAALECPPDGAVEHAAMIDAATKSAGVSIEPDAREVLAALLSPDRLAAASEIDKLMLFSGQARVVTAADVRATVENGATLAAQDLINAALGGRKATARLASRLTPWDIDPNALLSTLLWQLTTLHRAQVASAEGGGYRGGGGYETQGKAFDPATLLQLIDTLASAIADVRRQPRLAQALALRMLMEVSARAPG